MNTGSKFQLIAKITGGVLLLLGVFLWGYASRNNDRYQIVSSNAFVWRLDKQTGVTWYAVQDGPWTQVKEAEPSSMRQSHSAKITLGDRLKAFKTPQEKKDFLVKGLRDKTITMEEVRAELARKRASQN